VRFFPVVSTAAAAAALGLLAAGCGGSSVAQGTTTGTATTTGTTTGTTTTGTRFALSAADQAKLAKYRTCLQQHGVDFGFFGQNGRPPGASTTGRPPTGTTGGNGARPGGTTTSRRPQLTPAQQQARQKAFAACQSLAPTGFQFGQRGGPQGGSQGGVQSAAYRRCMEQHGITFAAPGSSGTQPNFNSSAFRKATQACGHLLVQQGTTTTGTTSTNGSGSG
jgi:hypothetical protein